MKVLQRLNYVLNIISTEFLTQLAFLLNKFKKVSLSAVLYDHKPTLIDVKSVVTPDDAPVSELLVN
jgi:hypothetical protein